MNKNTSFICLVAIHLVLSGCGSDFSVGGVSLEGTGNPPDTLPGGDGELKPGLPDEYIILTVPGPVVDQCGALSREIRFLDFEGNPINEPRTYQLGEKLNEDKNVIRVQVTINNTGKYVVSEQHPACYLPIELYKQDAPGRLYPFDAACEKLTEVIHTPGESQSYVVNYQPLMGMEAYWSYGRESIYNEKGQLQTQCEPLDIKFETKLQSN